MDSWYLENVVCPRDYLELGYSEDMLICAAGHRYPVVDGIPVMLLDEVKQTIGVAHSSLQEANAWLDKPDSEDHLYLDSVGISADEKEGVIKLASAGVAGTDPVVAFLVGATNGLAYKTLIGNLKSYPIPELRLPAVNGSSLLDLGCNWGRWCIAAARKGYEVVGIDPSLGAIMAARRVARSQGLSIKYLVADGRHLPFRPKSFENAFSYSVLQHMDRLNVRSALSEVSRVLKPYGISLIQMPNLLGVRCLYHQARRGFREARDFDVRYWSIPALRKLFADTIGKTEVSVDCFGGLGIQRSDWALVPTKVKLVIALSELLRKVRSVFPPILYVADSVYLRSVKAK